MTIKKEEKLANSPKGQFGLKTEKLDMSTKPRMQTYPSPPTLITTEQILKALLSGRINPPDRNSFENLYRQLN
ncbi:hypothetical protein [Hellea balneolensis]|uniref:hypothetical protein n=1 Tax=Hellea balneolensis TaxID=287478 RepID=UPI000478DB61|nr:hypothetical protein [Hellea balneolensis]